MGILCAVTADIDLENEVEPAPLRFDNPFFARVRFHIEHRDQVGCEDAFVRIVDSRFDEM